MAVFPVSPARPGAGERAEKTVHGGGKNLFRGADPVSARVPRAR
ncbi:hypothetical protein B4135_3931 [Caldibacillus debilis]|uniref:Uncharacterized protein n=1 Tax=Caldibacillus debilis TaxID=301148 RepID=A0A150L9U8_9BACI|nr:hypothetical protein B4135_3931 [Caldibacillus debilis]